VVVAKNLILKGIGEDTMKMVRGFLGMEIQRTKTPRSVAETKILTGLLDGLFTGSWSIQEPGEARARSTGRTNRQQSN
jgi:hypothetical protein